jgi:hypothetical protein
MIHFLITASVELARILGLRNREGGRDFFHGFESRHGWINGRGLDPLL